MSTRISAAALARQHASRGRGVPQAGQFGHQQHTAPDGQFNASQQHVEADDVTEQDGRLAAERARWGGSQAAVDGRSPWGAVQHADDIAPGITAVGTAGHGGIRLSPQRNREIPAPLRQSSGWYEEDCEARIVQWQFPEAFADSPLYGSDDAEAWRADAEASVKNWFPDQWEKATGGTVRPGESTTRDQQRFEERTAAQFVARSASRPESDFADVLAGLTLVTAHRRSDGAETTYLVSAEEYRGGRAGFIIDPERHSVWSNTPRPLPVPRLLTAPLGADAAFERPGAAGGTSTAAQRERAAQELTKRWRDDDGSILTTAQLIDKRGGIVGKTAIGDDNGRLTYHLEHPDGHLTTVSSATWATCRADDTRTESEIARNEWDRATTAARKARDAALDVWGPGARAADQKAHTAHERAARAEARYRDARARDDDRRRREQERITAAGADLTRTTLPAATAAATAAIEAAGGFQHAQPDALDRYRAVLAYGHRHHLFTTGGDHDTGRMTEHGSASA